MIAGLLLGCGGEEEDEGSARAPCERLADHLIDLRLATAKLSAKELEQHRAALKQALGTTFVANCQTNNSQTQVDCALAASDSDAATACMARAND